MRTWKLCCAVLLKKTQKVQRAERTQSAQWTKKVRIDRMYIKRPKVFPKKPIGPKIKGQKIPKKSSIKVIIPA